MECLVLCRAFRFSLLIFNFLNIVSTEHFEIEHGKKIKADLIHMEGEAVSALDCTYKCSKDDGCISASYNNDQGLCHLSTYRVNGTADQEGLTIKPSWMTFYKGCLKGWHKIGEACYIFIWKRQNYSDAQREFEWFADKINYHYWFGLNDMEAEGTFAWTSNSDIPEYTAWGDDMPDNWQNNEDCVCLDLWTEFKWNDRGCSERMDTLCEI